MTKHELEKSVNGTYTRMLRMALNVLWQEHKTNSDGRTCHMHRLRFAGHCVVSQRKSRLSSYFGTLLMVKLVGAESRPTSLM